MLSPLDARNIRYCRMWCGVTGASPAVARWRGRVSCIRAVPVADPASAITRPYRSAARRPFLRPGAGKA